MSILLVIKFVLITSVTGLWAIPPSPSWDNTTTTITSTTTSTPRTTTTPKTTTSTTSTARTTTPRYSKTIICKGPSTSKVTKDAGNYGDLLCADGSPSGDQLLVRDTIINYDQESHLYYQKNLSNIVVTRVNVLNFGRLHGLTKSVTIRNGENGRSGGSVDVEINVPVSQEIRLFVEIYGQSLDNNVFPQRFHKNFV